MSEIDISYMTWTNHIIYIFR